VTPYDAQGAVMTSYLDHAATTPVRPVALEAMLPFFKENFGNPSGVYGAGRSARRAVDDARDAIAAFCGCEPGEVIFTSGGTEADNLAIQGVASRGAGSVVTSTIEHHAVLNPARRAAARVVGATANGIIDLAALEAALDETVALVSVMSVNNELGTIQPIPEVVDLARRLAPGALVHTDAVQAAPWFDLARLSGACDLVSISAHKIGGPKGAGALVIRKRARGKLLPIVVGGGQERSMRPGTENVAGIVGMAAAATEAASEREARRVRVCRLRDRFLDGLAASTTAVESVPRATTAPGFAHVRFPGLLAEELLVMLDERGVAASAGSACSSGAIEPSHVLVAIGWPSASAREGVRFTLGHTTSEEEIDHALRAIEDATATLSSRMAGAKA
jgi:cysteine desulfurase